MKKLKGKKQILLYAISGLGVNMLNLIVGTYLCDALMVEGFSANVENWTYFNKTLVVAGVWSIMILVAKILDGVIDLPFAAWTDNLKTKWGKRRPAILIGLIPMVIAYILFLFPLDKGGESLLNTIYLGVILCIFYSFYTLTMVTYYATFSEIVENDRDRVFLSNCKSVFDVVYFVLGYALIPVLIGSANIRIIAFIFLPLVLTMLIPLFMIKEKSTLDKDMPEQEKVKMVGIVESVKYAAKNKSFMIWMGIYAVMQFGVQMFLSGQNVYLSGVAEFQGWQVTVLNALSFAPVPFTLILYNKIINKKGFRVAFRFTLAMFTLGMCVMTFTNKNWVSDGTVRFIIGIIASLICSFAIGSFFSIGYIVPSFLANKEEKETGVSHPAMYFAIQGLVGGVATGISTGLIWVNLKDSGNTYLMGIIVALGCIATLALTLFMPKSLNDVGKVE